MTPIPILCFYELRQLLTRTKWWVIPIVWIPVVYWLVSKSIQKGLTSSQAAMIVACGLLIWTFTEYSLHRFLFHSKTKTYWENTLHYLLHGCHHKHHMDVVRLVFPPAVTAIICVRNPEESTTNIASIQQIIMAINALSKGFSKRPGTASRPAIGLMFK